MPVPEHWIEEYVDGDLAADKKALLEQAMQNDAEFNRDVQIAHDLKRELSAMPVYRSPNFVWRMKSLLPTRKPLLLRPGFAMAASLMLVVTVAWQGWYVPTQERVKLEKGRQDLAIAMYYLQQAGNKTTRGIGDFMLDQGMNQALREGLQAGFAKRKQS